MSVQLKANKHAVYPHSHYGGSFVVESGTSGNLYKVGQYTHGGAYFCSCPWGLAHPGGLGCSHIVAVTNYVGRQNVIDEPEPGAVVSGITVHPDGSVEVKYR